MPGRAHVANHRVIEKSRQQYATSLKHGNIVHPYAEFIEDAVFDPYHPTEIQLQATLDVLGMDSYRRAGRTSMNDNFGHDLLLIIRARRVMEFYLCLIGFTIEERTMGLHRAE
jgi:hypothetical protein